MGKIMNSPKGVKSGVPERVSISCPTCGTRHDNWKQSIPGNATAPSRQMSDISDNSEGTVNKICTGMDNRSSDTPF